MAELAPGDRVLVAMTLEGVIETPVHLVRVAGAVGTRGDFLFRVEPSDLALYSRWLDDEGKTWIRADDPTAGAFRAMHVIMA